MSKKSAMLDLAKFAITEAATYEARWTDALKAEYAKEHPENCAGPDGSFPIKDAADVPDAWDLAGHAADPDAVRAKIKSIARRLGFTSALPDTAKDDEKQESASITSGWRPQKKIATLPIRWLEYGARSANGRIYPKATCDAIFKAASRKIAQATAVPQNAELPTTYVSHEDANGNVNTHLVGGPTKVWQEGSQFWANLDMADTSIARDMVALAEGGYLRSGSMRVLGVDLVHDRAYDLPLVVVQEGAEVEFLGIDLTTRPGLTGIARIPQVLYEDDSRSSYSDAFLFESRDIQKEEEPPMATIPLYLQVIAEAMTPDRAAHSRVHDHLAGVLDETIKAVHGEQSESLRRAAALTEEGRAIAQKHAKRLAAAHDESAKQLGMDCEGAYNEALGIALDPDQDGVPDAMDPSDNPDDGESAKAKGEEKPMTEEEMLAALKAKGYSVEAPKTAEEKIAALEAKLEEQDRKLAALAESAPTQRQTQALGTTQESELQPEPMYQEGDYLAGALKPANWRALADRRVPWPKDMDPRTALHELAPFITHRLLEQEATLTGRAVDQMVGPYEQL